MKAMKMMLAGLALVGATLLTGCGSSPEGVVNDYFAAMKDGNVEKLATLGGADAKEAKKQLAKNPLMQMQIEAGCKDASLKIVETKMGDDGKSATIIGEIVKKDGEVTEKLTFSLKKVDGKWLVSGAE